MMLGIFSKAFWPCVYLLWRNVCSHPLPILKIGSFVSLLLSCKSSSYSLDIEMWFSHVFSGSWLFFKVSLEDLKFLILKKFDLSVSVLLWIILFCVLSKKSWSNPSSQRFSLMFPSWYFKFQLLLLGIWFILSLFLYMVQSKV